MWSAGSLVVEVSVAEAFVEALVVGESLGPVDFPVFLTWRCRGQRTRAAVGLAIVPSACLSSPL